MNIGIKNIEGLDVSEILREVDRGAKFVYYQYAISIVVMTFKRSSEIHFVRSGEMSSQWKYSLLSFLFGWWGFPWGPIYTIGTLGTNFTGGKNVTNEVMNAIMTSAQNAQDTPPATPPPTPIY